MYEDKLYWYLATLLPTKRDLTGIIDGDSMHITMDMGDHIYTHKAIRAYGINAPEMSTIEGKAAKNWAIDWFNTYAPHGFLIHTFLDPDDKYGRLLARIYALSGKYYNDDAIEAGMAKPYFP